MNYGSSTRETLPEYPKPASWVALNAQAAGIFAVVKKIWGIGNSYEFSTRSITDGTLTLTQPEHQAAFVLRRLQALHHVTSPGVRVDNVQGKSIALELSRLLQHLMSATSGDDARRLGLFAVDLTGAAAALNSPVLGGNSNERCIFL